MELAVAERAKVRRISGAAHLRFRCAGCGTCCRLWVPITTADVRRLAAGTGLGAGELVQFVAAAEFTDGVEDLTVVALGARKRRMVMCLRERGDGCRFLAPDRCLAYEHRPLVCREFPFILDLDDAEERIEAVEMNDGCDCSGTTDGEPDEQPLVELYRQSMDEEEEYDAAARRWNRRKRPGTAKELLEYLGLLNGRA